MANLFTPGPWFVFGNGHCVGGPTGPMGAPAPGGKTAGIALCGMRLRTDAEVVANAQLVAAAPDLLAACEALLAAAEIDDTCVFEGGAELAVYEGRGAAWFTLGLVAQFRAALARARGEETAPHDQP